MTDHTTAESFEGLDQDYESRLTLTASTDAVFDALTTIEGLAGWWAPVTGDGLTGGELTFKFDPAAPVVMRVDAADRGVETAPRLARLLAIGIEFGVHILELARDAREALVGAVDAPTMTLQLPSDFGYAAMRGVQLALRIVAHTLGIDAPLLATLE